MGHTTKLPIRCPQNKGNHKPTQYIVCTLTYLLNQDKSVDSWIDELDPCETSNLNTIVTSQDLTMAWLLQQNLPCIQILLFNGSPFTWVEFVTKFKDIVHDQSYLNNSQKLHYLQQHVTGECNPLIVNLQKRICPIFKKTKVHLWTEIKNSTSTFSKNYKKKANKQR